MNKIDFSKCLDSSTDVYECTLFGAKVLLTNERIDRTTIPKKLYAYDLRSCDGKRTVENFVGVNYDGTIMSVQPIEDIINDQVYIDILDGQLDFGEDPIPNIAEHLLLDDHGKFEYGKDQVHTLSPENRQRISVILVQPLGGLDDESIEEACEELCKSFDENHYDLSIITDCYKSDWIEDECITTIEYVSRLLEYLPTLNYVAFPNVSSEDDQFVLERSLCESCQIGMIELSDTYWDWDLKGSDYHGT